MKGTENLPAGIELTEEDFEVSATILDLGQLDKVLAYMKKEGGALQSYVDLGCGLGGLTLYIAAKFNIQQILGVDRDEDRLATAARRGVQVVERDLDTDSIPCDDVTQDLATSFGVFEHMVYYDNIIAESFRILRPGGWFLVAMPNLGSYLNRAALMLGFQPRDVEISHRRAAGILPGYQKTQARGAPISHLHAATLRAMRELLAYYGFEVKMVRGSSPDFGSRRLKLLDSVFGHIPSLSRRFIILCRKPPNGHNSK